MRVVICCCPALHLFNTFINLYLPQSNYSPELLSNLAKPFLDPTKKYISEENMFFMIDVGESKEKRFFFILYNGLLGHQLTSVNQFTNWTTFFGAC